MHSENYSVTQYSIAAILGLIEAGQFVVPEIQRPFVWKRSQVRDLIDSLYNGYPTGYIIIWKNPDVTTKQGGSSEGKKILIDGQQRITALMAAISGKEVLDDDFELGRIRIAFNPLEDEASDKFAVQDASHLKNKKWIPDVSILFKPDFKSRAFEDRYVFDNPGTDVDALSETITKMKSIANRQIGVIELDHRLQIDEVTEIFIRINSQGTRLSQSDFVMSKIASDEKYGGNTLRKAIDYFCHLAAKPEFYTDISVKDSEFFESEYGTKMKWLKDDREEIYDPVYNDMIRVSFMHKFNRGKLADLVGLLSGRDFDSRDYKESIAEESYAMLKSGVLSFINEFNFTSFILAIKSAGFISSKLLNSKLTLDFAYTLYLLLMADSEIPKTQIKRYVAKWFVLSTLTSRYIGSPETAMDRDIRTINEKGFLTFFSEAEAGNLSNDFWDVTLIQHLETSAVNSPYFNTYVAAQIFNNDSSLFTNGTKVGDLVAIMGDVHHIFPAEYLKANGIKERSKYNQVANFTYLDAQVNISIGKKPPNEYFSDVFRQCETGSPIWGNITNVEELKANLASNCVPINILNMTIDNYSEFLQVRRKHMALKIRDYYRAL